MDLENRLKRVLLTIRREYGAFTDLKQNLVYVYEVI